MIIESYGFPRAPGQIAVLQRCDIGLYRDSQVLLAGEFNRASALTAWIG